MLVNTKDNLQRCTKYISRSQTITFRIHRLYNITLLSLTHNWKREREGGRETERRKEGREREEEKEGGDKERKALLKKKKRVIMSTNCKWAQARARTHTQRQTERDRKRQRQRERKRCTDRGWGYRRLWCRLRRDWLSPP